MAFIGLYEIESIIAKDVAAIIIKLKATGTINQDVG